MPNVPNPKVWKIVVLSNYFVFAYSMEALRLNGVVSSFYFPTTTKSGEEKIKKRTERKNVLVIFLILICS